MLSPLAGAGAATPEPPLTSPEDVSASALLETPAVLSATATALELLPPPMKVRPRERANSPDGLHTALLLREELDLKGKIRSEKIMLRTENGSAADRLLLTIPGGLWGLKWSPDGRRLAVHRKVSDQEGRLMLVDVESGSVTDVGGDARQVLDMPFGFVHALFFSPNGRGLLISVHPPGAAGAVPGAINPDGALFIVDTATGTVRKRIEWE